MNKQTICNLIYYVNLFIITFFYRSSGYQATALSDRGILPRCLPLPRGYPKQVVCRTTISTRAILQRDRQERYSRETAG